MGKPHSPPPSRAPATTILYVFRNAVSTRGSSREIRVYGNLKCRRTDDEPKAIGLGRRRSGKTVRGIPACLPRSAADGALLSEKILDSRRRRPNERARVSRTTTVRRRRRRRQCSNNNGQMNSKNSVVYSRRRRRRRQLWCFCLFFFRIYFYPTLPGRRYKHRTITTTKCGKKKKKVTKKINLFNTPNLSPFTIYCRPHRVAAGCATACACARARDRIPRYYRSTQNCPCRGIRVSEIKQNKKKNKKSRSRAMIPVAAVCCLQQLPPPPPAEGPRRTGAFERSDVTTDRPAVRLINVPDGRPDRADRSRRARGGRASDPLRVATAAAGLDCVSILTLLLFFFSTLLSGRFSTDRRGGPRHGNRRS